jgi:hypothetical protein
LFLCCKVTVIFWLQQHTTAQNLYFYTKKEEEKIGFPQKIATFVAETHAVA